jgi:hypothetical protein
MVFVVPNEEYLILNNCTEMYDQKHSADDYSELLLCFNVLVSYQRSNYRLVTVQHSDGPVAMWEGHHL